MKTVGILGAGPAGLISALSLIEGAEVCVFEQSKAMVSSLCGEAIAGHYLDVLKKNTNFNSDSFKREKGLKGYLEFPRGENLEIQQNVCVLDRNSWQKSLADTIIRRGGEFQLGTKIINVDFKKGKLTFDRDEGFHIKKFDRIIDATGPKGQYRNFKDYLMASQVTLPRPGPDFPLTFLLDKRYSEHGSWLFPKGKECNIGTIGKIDALRRLMKSKNLEKGHGKLLSARIPIGGPKEIPDHFALGDCAGMCGAVSGGGLHLIIEGAQVLKDNLKKGNISNYWQQIHALSLHNTQEDARKALGLLSQKQLEKLGGMLKDESILDLSMGAKLSLSLRPGLKNRFRTFIRGFIGFDL